ncbi:MAG: glycosyltransferase family 2 protein, partial [Bacteroidaceae bacterium]|nr:glycosyltransferase family 2 protein [Bacteroidaceae bacterium]
VHHEDYAFWLSVLKSGYIARSTSTVTALYRVRKLSVSANKLRVMAWQWHIYRQVENIGILRSIYYFCNYAISGLRKALI